MAIVATVLLELLLLAMLLSIGMFAGEEEPQQQVRLTTFDSSTASEEPAADPQAEDAVPESAEAPVSQPSPAPSAPPVLEMVPIPRPSVTPRPVPTPQVVVPDSAPPQDSRPRAVIRSDRTYGPANTGGRANSDTQVVGTAPDGSPLYAARWFREPTRQEMAGYLSTVEPPAWALIACKTAPRWEVVDCVPLDQSSPNSNIMNAVLASTWQYQVRPPMRGSESLVGAWVRIRISYTRGGPQASY